VPGPCLGPGKVNGRSKRKRPGPIPEEVHFGGCRNGPGQLENRNVTIKSQLTYMKLTDVALVKVEPRRATAAARTGAEWRRREYALVLLAPCSALVGLAPRGPCLRWPKAKITLRQGASGGEKLAEQKIKPRVSGAEGLSEHG